MAEDYHKSVPLFLKKLWHMLHDDETYDEIISWNETGDGFIIHDQVHFLCEVLPKYFKHNNLSSFVRQLNMYGFHKVACIEKDTMEFTHIYFLKDSPSLISLIKRKALTIKTTKEVTLNNYTHMEDIINTVKQLTAKNKRIENDVQDLKQENLSLWGEISSLRLKNNQQSKIINKLIRFLMTYMQQQRPLMKQNRATNEIRVKARGPTIFELESNGSPNEIWKKFDEKQPNPPIIQVADDDEDMELDEPVYFEVNPEGELVEVAKDSPIVDESSDSTSASSNAVALNYDLNLNSQENIGPMIDNTQIEMESLQEILNSLSNSDLGNISHLFENDAWMQKNKDQAGMSTEIANLPSADVDFGFDLDSMPELKDLLNV